MEKGSEKRSLRYDFTAVETHDLSIQLANKNKEIESLEKEKQSVVSQFTARSKKLKAEINMLSNQVSDGFEYRDVDCEVDYHKPTQGKKTIVRKDSNKVTAVEAMQDWEWNLFNQPDLNTNEKLEEPAKSKKGRKKKNAVDTAHEPYTEADL